MSNNGIKQQIQAGWDWERSVFGFSAKDFPKYPRYEDLHAAIDRAASLQGQYGWDPKNPSTKIGLKLYESVKVCLEPGDAADLEFYCSLGTALDWYHGADAFFRIRTHVVLIDITTRHDKRPKGSIIFMKSSRSENGISQIGKQIADVLNRGIQKFEETQQPSVY